MDTEKINPFMRQLVILHTAMFLGQFFFLGVVLFIGGEKVEEEKFFTFIVPIGVLIGFVVGHLMYRALLSKLPANASLEQRLSTYRSASIVKWALLEGPTLFTLVAYMFTGRMIFIAYVGMMLLVFALNRPTKSKLETELGLSGMGV